MLSQTLATFKTTGSFTTDIIVLAILFLIFFFYAVYFGKASIISLIVGFYPAAFLYEKFPFFTKLLILKGDKLLLLNKFAIFLIFLIPIQIIISRFVFADSGLGGSSNILKNLGFALASVAIVLLFSYTVLSLDSLYNFSSQVDVLFASADRVFWWMVAPLGLLFFL